MAFVIPPLDEQRVLTHARVYHAALMRFHALEDAYLTGELDELPPWHGDAVNVAGEAVTEAVAGGNPLAFPFATLDELDSYLLRFYESQDDERRPTDKV